ncbi:lysine--tRNA ligase-like [Cotesia glomerata]|uniref:lysine--tRNA ligase-like n=1 Tax=Cotesia glomerata TaxID=32391 RepID=UPI001D03592B|nr:lysine--tRNA ligase-like [Cotesia glomerata]
MTPNPEFTSCDFYMAYADEHDLMVITETLVSGMVKSIHGIHKLVYHPDRPQGENVKIDFTPPRQLPVIKILEEKLGVKFPDPEELNSEEANKFLSDLCIKHNVECPSSTATARLLGTFDSQFVMISISTAFKNTLSVDTQLRNDLVT